MNTIFTTAPRNLADQKQLAADTYRAHKELFPTRQMLRNWMKSTYAPPDLSWVFKTNAKAASSSTLAYLFQLHFGAPLNVGLQTPADPNPDTAAHRLRDAHVFRSLLDHEGVEDVAETLATTFTFAVVRHPAKRALSAFRYICQANDAGSEKFLRDRLRLSALTGFDWGKHPGTQDGFIRFLNFIKSETPNAAITPVNTHWRPQVMNVQPGFLKPDLLGKTEDLPSFFNALSDHFGKPPQEVPHKNAQPHPDGPDFLSDKIAKNLISQIYAADFESFGYDA